MPSTRYSYDDIARAISRHFGIVPQQLSSTSRKRRRCMMRWAAIHLARRFTKLSLPQLGDRLHRDHTTIMHGAARALELIESRDPKFRSDLAAILRRLRSQPRQRQRYARASWQAFAAGTWC